MTNPNEFDDRLRAEVRDYNRPGDVPRERMWARIEAARAASATGAQAGTSVVPLHGGRRPWLRTAVAVAALLIVGIGIGRLYEQHASSGNTQVAQTMSPGTTTPSAPESTVIAPSPAAAPDAASRIASGAGTAEGRHAGASSSVPASVRDNRELANRQNESEVDRGGMNSPGATNMAYRLAMLQHLAGTEAMLISFRTSAKTGEVDAQLTKWARDLLTTTRLMQASPAATDPTMKRLLDDLELVLVQIAQYTAAGEHRAEELDLIEHSIERRGVLPKLRTTIPSGNLPAGT
jgi:hypothetical protein